jgi:hypothetical protein
MSKFFRDQGVRFTCRQKPVGKKSPTKSPEKYSFNEDLLPPVNFAHEIIPRPVESTQFEETETIAIVAEAEDVNPFRN